MTVLIVTRKDDVHADLVIRHLVKKGCQIFRFNTECAHEYDISITLEASSSSLILRKNGRLLSLGDVDSVYLRRRSFPCVPIDSDFEKFVHSEWLAVYKNMWQMLSDCTWVNNPDAIEKASHKLFQLRTAVECGFNIPQTLVTNSPSSLRLFLEKSSSKAIYKAFNSGEVDESRKLVIYTNTIGDIEERRNWEDGLIVCPGIFQNQIEKSYEVRVTVVGNQVFSAHIDSQSNERTRTDWRRYDFDRMAHSKYTLPQDVSEKCVTLVKKLDLTFGAIDLIVTPEGEYVFLEINANGQWAWIEFVAGHPISEAIANELCS